MTQKPNILFFQVDQLFATALTAYGGPAITPNLDRLAANGVVFENAYCNYPLCAPSRASMATGKLCSEIGAYDNAAELPASVPTYAHYLRDLGYVTALSGKMHFIGPDQHHGFEQRLTPDLYPADFSWVPNWGYEGKRDTNDPRTVRIAGKAKHTMQMEFDELSTKQAIEFIRKPQDRPFFLQVSWTHPHDPYLCPKAFWDLYDDHPLPVPAVPALEDSAHDQHSLRLLKDFGMYGVTFSEDEIANARRGYYGAVSYIDAMVGEILDALETSGLAENTAVIFTSDHGDMLGERGLWMKKHFFDPSLKVPLLLYAPWIEPQRVAELSSLVDLLPTFCGLATGENWASEVEQLDGTDLTQFLDQDPKARNRTIFAEYLAEATTSPIFMVRRGAFKLVISANDPPLLYDLDNDPNEMSNLASDPAYKDVFAELSEIATQKWDSDALAHDIVQSQKRRQLIRSAMGLSERWNHGEKPGEEVIWYRGQGSYNEWAFAYEPEGE